MALTKIGKEGITGVSNSADATFLTATSGEGVTLAGTLAVTGVHTIGTNAVATSDGGAATTSIVQGLAKAWIDFNGTGTVAIADSFNITSITDNTTGDYSVTIANDMGNANYVHAGNSGGANSTSVGAVYAFDQGTTRTTTLFRVYLLNASANPVDTPTINIIVSGDLA